MKKILSFIIITMLLTANCCATDLTARKVAEEYQKEASVLYEFPIYRTGVDEEGKVNVQLNVDRTNRTRTSREQLIYIRNVLNDKIAAIDLVIDKEIK